MESNFIPDLVLVDHDNLPDYQDIKIQPIELFGGAIKLDLPQNIVDVSTFRQVPDTQEVFISRDSDEDKNTSTDPKTILGREKQPKIKDLSIIIEVLELVNLKENEEFQQRKKNGLSNLDGLDEDDNNPKSIISYHFDSLAFDNSSKVTRINWILLPKQEIYQMQTPSNEESDLERSTSSNSTVISRNLQRKTPEPVKLNGTQLISKFNSPDRDSHHVHIWLGLWRLNGIGNNGNGTDLVLTFNLPQLTSQDDPEFRDSLHLVNEFFQRATKSLEILDWSLFG